MSSSLIWKPIVVVEGKSLPDELKFVLRKKGLPMTVSRYNIDYFEGLMDAGIKGAEEVLTLINLYDQVELSEEY